MNGPAEASGLVIIGAGGFGREVLDVVEAMQGSGLQLQFVGLIDDGDPDLAVLQRRRAIFLGSWEQAREQVGGAGYVVAVGDPRVRRELDGRARSGGLQPVAVVHPAATFGADCRVGAGSVVCSHVSVTTNVSIGRHVHLNLNSTVGHDCELGDYVTVNPGANISGSVRLGDDVTLGTGAAIIQGVSVGAGTTIGAGAVVTRDLPAGVIAVGCPAKPVRSA